VLLVALSVIRCQARYLRKMSVSYEADMRSLRTLTIAGSDLGGRQRLAVGPIPNCVTLARRDSNANSD
jgi:hypothetical protein